MRNTAYIVLALIVVSCNSSPFKDYENNLKYVNNLDGNIKKLKSETFDATEKFGELVIGEPTQPYFDLSEHIFNLISPNSTVEFAKNGKPIFREVINYIDFSYSFSITYDDDWNVIEERYQSNKYESITKYKNENNKIISSITYDKDGEVIRKSNFKYEMNLITEEKSTDIDGTLMNMVKYSYDNGVQNQSFYDESGEHLRTFKKDAYGRYLEIVYFDFEKKIIHYENKYRFPSKIQIYKDNEIDGKLEISFDNNKNISEIKDIDEDGEVKTFYRYVYKIDNQGNWIEQSTYRDDILKYITFRTIEYY